MMDVFSVAMGGGGGGGGVSACSHISVDVFYSIHSTLVYYSIHYSIHLYFAKVYSKV